MKDIVTKRFRGVTLCFRATLLFALTTALLNAQTRESTMPTVYHFNAVNGRDDNTGLTRDSAWKTFAPLKRIVLNPGDRVLLAGGQTFAGPLELKANGTPERRIVVESSDKEPAGIAGGEGTGIDISGSACLTLRHLQVTGCGRKDGNNGNGILALRTQSLEIDRVEVKGFRNAGVLVGGDTGTRLTRIRAHDNGFAGITAHGGYGDLPMTQDLYIGHCQAYDNPGDPANLTNHSGNGIVVGGLKKGLIEYCEAWNNGWDMPRKGNGPVGIWGWFCDRLVIQHCISHDNKTAPDAWDGGGFDLDGGATNSILQYNLSYNNHGTGYLLCQYPKAAPWENNICRFNISIQDGQTNHFDGIHFWNGGEGMKNAQVYNNTVINSRHAVSSSEDIPGLVFSNNIFLADQEVIVGPFRESLFHHNLYWSRQGKALFQYETNSHTTLKSWQKASGNVLGGLMTDPLLRLPPGLQELPTTVKALSTLTFFTPSPTSPIRSAGKALANGGGRDLLGKPLPKRGAWPLGAVAP